ncbi:MAG: diaminopimelate decarboxylase [Ruminococcaceae bacterium]|nr:diaminopimelate decarboxylase [Oscillospiraceae bacterium]
MDNDLIKKAICKFKTPFYLYNEKEITNSIHTLTDTLPETAQLFYSLKANPNLKIIKLIRKQKVAVEVSSIGEIKRALKAGVKPWSIIFSGPGKQKEELQYAIKKGVFCINVESLDEIKLINKIGMERSVIVNVAIRINPNLNSSKTSIKMTGIASQFGIDEASIDETIRIAKKLKNIKIIGIQLYSGTQLLNYEDILFNTKTCIEYSRCISEKHQLDFSYINFGGGFGIPYFNGEQNLDCYRLKLGLEQLFCENNQYLKNMRCVFESGRFLIADAGVFVTKILYKKISHGKIFLVCDGGSNFHANSAFLGRRVRYNFPITVITKETIEATELVTITGPLCTPTDVIAQDILLPQCNSGDYIVVEKSGAYGLTNSPVLFISHPKPVEALFINEEWKEV